MKTILITGGTGFLGSYIIKTLYRSYNVILLKRSTSNPFRLEGLLGQIKSYDIDLMNLEKVFQENNIDIIIHTATNYGKSGESMQNVINSNVLLPIQLVELAIKYRVQTFINSDTFYNTNDIKYSYLKNYALSKHHILQWLIELSSEIKIINVIIGTIFGPHDNGDKFIPQMIKRMLNNEEEITLTTGLQKRNFVYVEDVARGFLIIANHSSEIQESFTEFNIGYGHSMSIREITELMHKLSGSTSTLSFGKLGLRPNEIMDPDTDIKKISMLGWQPETTLEEGLLRTINFEKNIMGIN